MIYWVLMNVLMDNGFEFELYQYMSTFCFLLYEAHHREIKLINMKHKIRFKVLRMLQVCVSNGDWMVFV